MEETRNFDIKSGSCTRGACVGEAACKEFENNTHTCVCPHDSRPPTESGTCPRKIVPVDPGRIPNVQPPSKNLTPGSLDTGGIYNNNDTHPTIEPSTWDDMHLKGAWISASLLLFLLILVAGVLLYLRFRLSLRKIGTQSCTPVNLKHGLLLAERYAPNPHYVASVAAEVPLLKTETLRFLNEIGEGCFGKVFKGELLCESDCMDLVQVVAIKVLKENATREAEEDFIREVEIMSAFKHPNILSLRGMVMRDGAVSPMMVFEFMPLGDLAELLRAQNAQVPPSKDIRKHLMVIALQIANGMRYLASQRFVHRDLACRNCLVADGPTVKIADFGMSRDVYTCDYYKIGGSRLLPVRWMSPESVVYGKFTLESDIWSYGVVLWEIFTLGRQPYYGHTNEEAVELILNGTKLVAPPDCPKPIVNLMDMCWRHEPRDRIRFPAVVDYIRSTCKQPFASVDIEEFTDHTIQSDLPLSTTVSDTVEVLDLDGYLLANPLTPPAQYLETFASA